MAALANAAASGTAPAPNALTIGGDALLNLLRIYGLIGTDSTNIAKALQSAAIMSSASNISGALGGPTIGSAVGAVAGPAAGKFAGGTVGPALAAAGTGYNLANIAGSDMSRNRKLNESAGAVGDLAISAIPVAGPIYGAAQAGRALGSQMQRSSSPEVRGAGTAIRYAAAPSGEQMFQDVIRGRASPRAAFANHGGLAGAMYDTMGPIGAGLRGAGVELPFLSHTPTHGTQFRDQLGSVFGRVPTLSGLDYGAYNIDPNAFNALTPEARNAARLVGNLVAQGLPSAATNREAYAIQAQNILLNRYGNDFVRMLPDVLPRLLGPAGGQPATGAGTPPTPTTPGPGLQTIASQIARTRTRLPAASRTS